VLLERIPESPLLSETYCEVRECVSARVYAWAVNPWRTSVCVTVLWIFCRAVVRMCGVPFTLLSSFCCVSISVLHLYIHRYVLRYFMTVFSSFRFNSVLRSMYDVWWKLPQVGLKMKMHCSCYVIRCDLSWACVMGSSCENTYVKFSNLFRSCE